MSKLLLTLLATLAWGALAESPQGANQSLVPQPVVIAGSLSWKYSHRQGKYVDLRVQSAGRHYVVFAKFLSTLAESEDWVKTFNGRRVVVAGVLESGAFRPGVNCLTVTDRDDISLQAIISLTGQVSTTRSEDARGAVVRVFFEVGNQRYEVVGVKAKEKLLLHQDQRLLVQCWLDGGASCRQIAEVAEIIPAPVK